MTDEVLYTNFTNVEVEGELKLDGALTVSSATITAHAGGGQANATAITTYFTNIGTVASAGNSVKLPLSSVGATYVVANSGANAAQIFGTSPDTINGVATGTGISIPVGAIFVFTCAVEGNWLQNVQTGGAFTGTFDGVLGGNTPAAATVTTLSTTGAATLASASVTANLTAGAYIRESVGNGLTAAGTTRADALQLAKIRNIITTAASGTGVILPVGVVGMYIDVFNDGANPIQVYASASETIDGTAGATGVPLTNAKRARFFFDAANTWISAQWGVVSA